MKRFSLKTLLLATAIIALFAALIVTNLQRQGDIEELSKLREVAGRLSISDESQVHAIPVAVAGQYTWQWQIYLPPEKEYEIVLFTEITYHLKVSLSAGVRVLDLGNLADSC